MTQPTTRDRRPDFSMTLLTEMLKSPLDPGYGAASGHRVAAGLPPATSIRTAKVLVTVLVMGLLFGISANLLRARSTLVVQAQADLVARIEQGQLSNDALSARLGDLQGEIAAAQGEIAAARGGQSGAEAMSNLSFAAGGLEVSGPGLVISLDDATKPPAARADEGRAASAFDEGRVQSRDLQIVVNSLWASGAETVDINGKRLTSRSAIRFAGNAILVNYRPLTRPYTVRAIGDPQQLPIRFAEGEGAAYLRALSTNYGVHVAVETDASITMASATSLTTSLATVADATMPSPSAPPTTSQEESP